MEVAKDRMPSSFTLEGSSPSSPLHFLNLSSLNPSSSSFYLFEDDNYPKQLSPNGEDDQNTGKSPSPPLSSSSSANYSNGFGAQQDSEFADNSLLGFKATQESYGEEFVHKSCGSNLVSFLPQGSCPSFGGSLSYEEYPMWEDSNNQLKLTSDWVYGDVNESPTQHSSFNNNKRHLPEEVNEQTLKKRCTSNGSSSKKQPSKPKSSTVSSKDPQSLAAKNRRERISERLKILQDLVPNGCKVDLVTMLDKAISYVKFLQLQVKVLATDEFWPVEGGKPPNISQVREAIDAILSSQRDSPSSLSNEMNV